MTRLTPRTELMLAAFYFAHGSADTSDRDLLRLRNAVDATKPTDLPGRHDQQLLVACHRALQASRLDLPASRAGVDEVLSVVRQDKVGSQLDEAIATLGIGGEHAWMSRADLR